jgi:hypothetical protein
MPLRVDSVEILKRYFSGVVERANHHAPNVSDIIYKLLGIIIIKMDQNTSIEVRRGADVDATGNILWVISNGTRYAFRYEHADGTIEIRRGSYSGPLVLKIDNSTPTSTVIASF